jgi:hypothetical protein
MLIFSLKNENYQVHATIGTSHVRVDELVDTINGIVMEILTDL